MLLFIRRWNLLWNPCNKVSIHLMLLFIKDSNDRDCCTYMFQYISCYSLSPLPCFPCLLQVSFQYISCYSLSERSQTGAYCACVSIHLMLLFIAHYILINYLKKFVSIHLMLLFIRNTPCCKRRDRSVSIHLMLLFICEISGRSRDCVIVSIHLMLLFIDRYIWSTSVCRIVSIHLMLLFIW